jgi:hemoglobin-like flavoprotein
LNNLKETDPNLYTKKYDLVRRKYQRIYEEGRRNPELAKVLLADIELEERQEVLINKIKEARNENVKKQLMSQLEEVVSDKYDLIIRRKQIAYEFLLKRLQELQKELTENRELIEKWKDETIKTQNVKERIKELTEQSQQFRWR